MAQPVEETELRRDGVSQIERQLAALQPGYVSVDERDIKDLLTFAKAFAAELDFFEVNNGQVEVNGQWEQFFDGVDLDKAIAFLEAPETFSPQDAAPYTRLHFALFLTFLALLRDTQQHLNGLTKRHLDHYYQKVLQLTKRHSIADSVNVLVELAPRVEQFDLPAGTLLNAGTDSAGQDLVYRTEKSITVNQAQIAKLHSVFADKRAIGLQETWENRDLSPEKALVYLLQLALGEFIPGDALPEYPADTGILIIPQDKRKPIPDEDGGLSGLETLYKLLDFVPSTLYLEFDQYRNLVKRKDSFDSSSLKPAAQALSDWEVINTILTKAWQTKVHDPNVQPYAFKITNPRDFEGNVKQALHLDDNEFEDLFDGVAGVVTLTDAYGKRNDPEVHAIIIEKLYLPVDDDDTHTIGEPGLTFTAMMQRLIPIESNWDEIIRILALARQAKMAEDADFHPDPPDMPTLNLKDVDDFNQVLKVALGFDGAYPQPFVGGPIADLTAYDAHLRTLEAYFYMFAEDFHYFMSVALPAMSEGNSDSRRTTSEWEKVYSILDRAHKAKVYANRREQLKAVREENGFEAMLFLALGIDNPAESPSPLGLLGQYSLSPERMQFLEGMYENEDAIDASDPRWETTYDIVESIQRTILPEPLPQVETWRHLFPIEDAKSASVTIGMGDEVSSTRWRTFGEPTGDIPAAPSFGWAISSPLLDLSQGTRTVTLTLGFDEGTFPTEKLEALFSAASTIPFHIEITTEKGWVSPTINGLIGDYWTLSGQSGDHQAQDALSGIQFVLEFGEEIAPLVVLPPEGNMFVSAYPVLRLMMQPVASESDDIGINAGDIITPYLTFKDLILRRVYLKTDVENLEPSHIQNDETTLKPGKPFEPFGLRPSVGSRFYLSHSELVNKKLDSLTLNVTWMGVPANLGVHYANYPGISNNSSFKTQISLVDHRAEWALGNPSPLFDAGDATNEHPIMVGGIAERSNRYDRLLDFDTGDAVTEWDRYFQWELMAPDFQHRTYPGLAASKSIQLVAAIANRKSNDPAVQASTYELNPPYTPKIKRLTINYSSSLELVVENYQTGQATDQLYHIQPFGYNEIQPEPGLKGSRFLPQFDYEGELYIGIENLGSAQTLSLLFQMAEGSANPDLTREPVEWHYLSGNRWLSLEEGQLLEDETRGLINSGIVRFKLSAALPNTLLDPELYWIRVAIRRHSLSVCDAIDIHTQAVAAQWVDQGNTTDHLSQPLPPETITQLAQPKPSVVAIHQPYGSYGGKMAEQDETFYTRISERLRHKNRAVTPWDYEHLILEHFPQIYKVKCLPADPDQPGQVTIIVIYDIRDNALFDPFEPKAPANILADVETFLANRMPVHASLEVKNAHYVPVKVRFAVRFYPGVDEAYAKQQLNTDLNRFLSPWAYNISGDIVIGGRIYANVIINFIEERPYVDFVAEMRLFKSEDGRNFTMVPSTGTQGYWVEPADPDGVLVAARQHEIDIITEAGYVEENYRGINYMRIELDFIIADVAE